MEFLNAQGLGTNMDEDWGKLVCKNRKKNYFSWSMLEFLPPLTSGTRAKLKGFEGVYSGNSKALLNQNSSTQKRFFLFCGSILLIHWWFILPFFSVYFRRPDGHWLKIFGRPPILYSFSCFRSASSLNIIYLSMKHFVRNKEWKRGCVTTDTNKDMRCSPSDPL